MVVTMQDAARGPLRAAYLSLFLLAEATTWGS